MSEETKKSKSHKKAPVITPTADGKDSVSHIDEYFTRLERKIMNYFDRLDRRVDKNLFYLSITTAAFCAFITLYLFVTK